MSPTPLDDNKVKLDRYRIIEEIGAGGMGTVYRGVQLALDREVAIKMLKASLTSDASIINRFIQEALVVAKLNNPRIVTIFDILEADGRHFMIMEFVRGLTLIDLLRNNGPLPLSEVCRVGAQVCEGLEVAHKAGIIHRDIKPENIMAVPSGDIKVMDFGIARLAGGDMVKTQTGTSLGTPRYMSPEQIMARDIDHRTDLYSLGVVLYCLACGQTPFDNPSPILLAKMHLQETPPPPEQHNPRIGSEMSKVILKSIEKEPNARFQSGGDMGAHLRRLSQELADANERGISEMVSEVIKEAITPGPSVAAATIADGAAPHSEDATMAADTGAMAASTGPDGGTPVAADLSDSMSPQHTGRPQFGGSKGGGEMKSLMEVAAAVPKRKAAKFDDETSDNPVFNFVDRARIGRLSDTEAALLGFGLPGIFSALTASKKERCNVGWLTFATSLAIIFVPLVLFVPLPLVANWLYRSYWALRTILLNKSEDPVKLFRRWSNTQQQLIIGVVGIFLFGLVGLILIDGTFARRKIQTDLYLAEREKIRQEGLEERRRRAEAGPKVKEVEVVPPEPTPTPKLEARLLTPEDPQPTVDPRVSLAAPDTSSPRDPGSRLSPPSERQPTPTPRAELDIPEPPKILSALPDRPPLRDTEEEIDARIAIAEMERELAMSGDPSLAATPRPRPTPDSNLPAVPSILEGVTEDKRAGGLDRILNPKLEDPVPDSFSSNPEVLVREVLTFRIAPKIDELKLIDANLALKDAGDSQNVRLAQIYLGHWLEEHNSGLYQRLTRDKVMPAWDTLFSKLGRGRIFDRDYLVEVAGSASEKARINITEKLTFGLRASQTPALQNLFESDEDSEKRNALVLALQSTDPALGRHLAETLSWKNSDHYDGVFRWLAEYGQQDIIPILEGFMNNGLGDYSYRSGNTKLRLTITEARKNSARSR